MKSFYQNINNEIISQMQRRKFGELGGLEAWPLRQLKLKISIRHLNKKYTAGNILILNILTNCGVYATMQTQRNRAVL